MTASTSTRSPGWLPIFAAGTPALIFYWLLSKSVANLPIVDDYHSVLDFINRFSQLNDLPSRISYIIHFQHNEYKLAFESAIFAAQYSWFGSVNFTALAMLGNAFVLVLFLLLASSLRVPARSNAFHVALLLPVALLLFQLQYASTLNFSMGGLQNIAVLVFSFLSIKLLAISSPRHFTGACSALLLAISASGSGFLLGPIGAMMLVERRRWKHLAIWTVVGCAIALVYFNNYDFHSSPPNPADSISASARHFDVAYMLAFMGSSVARYQGYLPSIGVGIALLLIWALAARKSYSRQNPTIFYFVVFLVLTAAGVSTIRSGLGLEQSLASRYRIYSNLLLILSYIFLIETYLLPMQVRKRQFTVMGILIACSLGFFVLSNMAGFRFLKGRQQAVAYEMAAWQASTLNATGRPGIQPSLDFDPAVKRQLALGLYKPATATLLESIRLGTYHPPEPAER